MLLKVSSNIIRVYTPCNYILIFLLIVVGVSYIHAQDTISFQKRMDSNSLKHYARYGLYTPEEYVMPIIRDQIISEQKKQEYEEYLVHQPLMSYTGVNVNDSLAIVALYNRTNGDNWTNKTNWLSNKPMNEWYGIYLNYDNTRVNWIFLDENNLTGPIPAEIQNLTELTVLKLNDNHLNGEIPPEIGELSNLVELMLYKNELIGPISEEIGRLSNLTHLWLYSNELEDEIPEKLGDLTNLLYLWLDNNKLTGSIPATLGKLINLRQLTLYKNNFSGNIPSNIGDLKNLELLWLQSNELNGNIPPELGSLDKLETLSLSNNKLSGTIPNNLVNLTELLDLYLYDNKLDGSIPHGLENLSKLRGLYLHNNFISGDIPSDIGNLKKLEYLQLNNNYLRGKIPITFGGMDSLKGMWLYANQLDGQIPQVLGNLKKLMYLSLYSNKLSGSIPSELGNLKYLNAMFLDFNNLTGPIPSEISKLKDLTELDFSVNNLSGSIPPELGMLTNLEELHLYENILTDTIPHELGDLSKLKMLSLGRNKLKEPNSLPNLQTALWKLTELNWFLVDGNEFTKFPNLSTLPKLNTLEIHNNRLHFDALEPNINITKFKYAPQDSVGKAKIFEFFTGTNYTLELKSSIDDKKLTIGGSQNEFQWFKGKIPIPGATSDSYTISQADHLDTGHYTLQITNTVVKECTLYSRPITIMITETITLNLGDHTEVECNTLGLKIIADVQYAGDVRVLFFNSEPKSGSLPDGILRIADLYFTFEADPSLIFSNARLKIPLTELTNRGIDPKNIKWLRRPQSGTGDWIDLEGDIIGSNFVSRKTFDSFSEFTFGLTEITNVNQESYLPEEYRLNQNYPNPFNPSTTIKYSLPEQSNVMLKVFDVLGSAVSTLVNIEQPQGNYEVEFDATELTSGIYFYRLQAGEFVEIKKMILLR